MLKTAILALSLFTALMSFAEPAKTDAKTPTSTECNDTNKTYKICSDQGVPYKATLEKAKADNKLVLLSFGADWCPWCQSLHKIFGTADFQRDFDKNLVIQEIGVFRYDSRTKIESGMNILKTVIEANAKKLDMVDGYPFLVMLSPKNNKAVFIPTGSLEDNSHGKGHDTKKIKVALNKAIKQLKQ
jgi:thioredoxin-related protein